VCVYVCMYVCFHVMCVCVREGRGVCLYISVCVRVCVYAGE